MRMYGENVADVMHEFPSMNDLLESQRNSR